MLLDHESISQISILHASQKVDLAEAVVEELLQMGPLKAADAFENELNQLANLLFTVQCILFQCLDFSKDEWLDSDTFDQSEQLNEFEHLQKMLSKITPLV